MASVLGDAKLEALLDALHAQSDGQTDALIQFFRDRRSAEDLARDGYDAKSHQFLSDKLVGLDRDKALFCYQLCRAKGTRRIVEVGTSFGVSTLYLAAAVRDNGGGVVIGAEYEPAKATAARANFAAAGLSDFIDLHEGDLRETFKSLTGPIDFVLMDIWIEMARPALELIAPHLAPGAVLCADNVTDWAGGYADYFAFINDPANGFRTMTLPFAGGFEMTVKTG